MRISLMMKCVRFIPTLSLLIIAAASPAFAQFDTSTVLGTVRDATERCCLA